MRKQLRSLKLLPTMMGKRTTSRKTAQTKKASVMMETRMALVKSSLTKVTREVVWTSGVVK